jgi:T5SS/PEP-CTERM-associated repeat protein
MAYNLNWKIGIFWTMLFFAAFPLWAGQSPQGVTFTGNISPALPWDTYTNGYVGNTANGTLTVNPGAALSSYSCEIGFNNGVTGQVTVAGPNATWTNIDQIQVGSTPAGYTGVGVLNVQSGGKVTNGRAYIGDQSSATVTGAGSMWTNNDYLYVGYWGNGTLSILSGGKMVDNALSTVGYASASTTATVSGNGSAWTNADGLIVGDGGGNGTLSISAGAHVGSMYGMLGYSSGSNGTVAVTGAGSIWANDYYLAIGSKGAGNMTVSNGGSVTAGTDLFVGQNGSKLTVSSGGSVTATTIYAPINSLFGDSMITAKGAVLDGNLTFDAGHGQQQTLGFGSGGSLILNLDGTSVLGVGYGGAGTMTVAGVEVVSSTAYLGYGTGSNGTAIVSGQGSKWTSTDGLNIGYQGLGTLRIEAGGQVSDTGASLGNNNSTGTVVVSGPGSTWTNSGGIIVGYSGRGKLTIEKGGQVTSNGGGLGCLYNFGNGSSGTVAVTGPGSTWTNNGNLNIGIDGGGSTSTLNIKAGGLVVNNKAVLGQEYYTYGVVNVDGKGTRWTNNGAVTLGTSENICNGAVNISGGAAVTAASFGVYNVSQLAIDIGTGSTLIINGGAGTITNAAKIRFAAGAGAAANDVSTPIQAAAWSGSGTYQALGGKWDSAAHQFTVSPVQTGASGATISMNLVSTQRALVADSGSGWSLGASFLATTGNLTLNFKATAVSGTVLDKLQQALHADAPKVAGGWTFSTTGGYSSGNPVYLSFDLGGQYPADRLTVWRYSGTSWSEYYAPDLTSNGGYASFTVTSLDGFAVAVPEPGTLILLAAATGSALAYGRRFRFSRGKHSLTRHEAHHAGHTRPSYP